MSLFSDIGDGLGKIGSGFSDLFGKIGDVSHENLEDMWDKFTHGKTNEINKQIADRNFAFQLADYEYKMGLQERLFDREDTAYQRTVSDMRQAGLNPIMMTGTDSAGSEVPTEAPQNNYQHQGTGLAEILGTILSVANEGQNFAIGTSYSEEQKAKAEQAKAQASIANDEAIKSKIKTEQFINDGDITYNDIKRNMEYNEKLGIFNGMPENERMAKLDTIKEDEQTDAKIRDLVNKAIERSDGASELEKYLGKNLAGQITGTMADWGENVLPLEELEELGEWIGKNKIEFFTNPKMAITKWGVQKIADIKNKKKNKKNENKRK